MAIHNMIPYAPRRKRQRLYEKAINQNEEVMIWAGKVVLF